MIYAITYGSRDKNGEPIQNIERKLAPFMQEICKVWGGASVVPVKGYYVMESDGRLMIEDSYRIEVQITPNPLNSCGISPLQPQDAQEWFADLAGDLGYVLNQESVLVQAIPSEGTLQFVRNHAA